MSDSDCQIAGDVGVAVQLSLAVLVAFVLLTEYLIEIITSLCSPNQTRRSFGTFWFDSYKICAGALVSHFFNIAVSIAIDEWASNADQCAVYALAFYYEACGVPFVQLLQYGVIQYAVKMAYHSRSINSNTSIIDDQCLQRWQWISKPGIYDANRFPVNDCLHCRQCANSHARCNYFKIFIVMIIAVALSGISGYFGYTITQTAWYIDVSLGFLLCVFVLSTAIAPVSSLWQTVQWVVLKMFEKAIWSVFAISQASVFAKWSLMMSTGNTTLDAWLYIAIIPIIMNAFMFFMFSRISRLKLPCFAPKYTERIDRERNRLESLKHDVHAAPMLEVNSVSDNEDIDMKFDKKEAFKLGIVFMLIINVSLLVIATTFLVFNGAIESIWILFLSMIVAPTLCSVMAIYVFAYFVDHNIHVCGCCMGKSTSVANNENNYSVNQGAAHNCEWIAYGSR